MCHYVITRTFVDRDENIHTNNYLYYNEKKAFLDFEGMKDDIKAKVAFKYSVPFEEFDITEFAFEVKDTTHSFIYKDMEGDTNIKLEIKNIIPMC
jgi:hypothetical protein